MTSHCALEMHLKQMNYLYEISAVSIALVFAFSVSGCSIQYHDKDTGVTHLLGVGHMKMKVENTLEDQSAVISSVETLGLFMGSNEDDARVGLGWNDYTRLVVMDNSEVSFEWPDSDLFKVVVGNSFPDANEKQSNNYE